MLAELYAIAFAVLLVYGLHLLWLCYRYAGAPEVDSETYVVRESSFLPSVTVQLPVYNEAYVIERLLDACAQLDYPPRLLEVQVLDDSTDSTSLLVAERTRFWRDRGLDFVHVRRKNRSGYKAGALENGFRLSSGSLIAIFDADFVPPADFLRRMVPHLADPTVGMVQARWVHPDAGGSLITRIQAFGLDAHFALEQWVRDRLGYFINFNGTGGVWRRQAIEEAGGWSSDTITEDLDLSYRAQIAGWRLKYAHDVEIPADLPGDMAALRAQQFRWARGAVETAGKLMSRLWRSEQPMPVKVEGTFHLSGHLVFPFLLFVAVLHAPLMIASQSDGGAGQGYFATMALGLFGFAGFFLAHAFAQRDLYPDWFRRLSTFPLFLAGTMGISLSNSLAVAQAILRIDVPFVRTPKMGDREPDDDELHYRSRHVPPVAWVEAVLAAYCVWGVLALALRGLWASVPFQAFFALGFLLVALASFGGVGTRNPAATTAAGSAG